MKFNDSFLDVVETDLKTGAVPALMGEPGIGKSSFVEDLAKRMGTRAFTLPCNQLADKADLTGGRLVPTADGKSYSQVFYPHETIQDAIRYAEENPREDPLLFLDEINRSTSDVTSAALSLPTQRKIGSSVLPKNLKIIVAGNDKGNVTMLDDASISRFSLYHIEPDANTLIALLGPDLNPHVKAVLVRHPDLVLSKAAPSAAMVDGNDDDDDNAVSVADLLDSGEEMLQFTTPRTIDAVSRWLNAVDTARLSEYLQTQVTSEGRETTLLNEIITAKIGNTDFATHLVAEIATALTSGTASQISALTAPKPNCYSSLKAATTVDALEQLIGTLTDHEKSGSLVYALFERADNRVVIEQLATQTGALEGDHTRLLVQLAASSLLDEGNVNALFGSSTPVGENTRAFLSTFMS